MVGLLRGRSKKEIDFDDLMGGGMVENRFRGVMYVKNLTNGRVEFAGEYRESTNDYVYTQINLKYK